MGICGEYGGEEMRKIAMIMDGWQRSFTYAWPAGVLERIRKTNEEINLYIFNSFGDWTAMRRTIRGSTTFIICRTSTILTGLSWT